MSVGRGKSAVYLHPSRSDGINICMNKECLKDSGRREKSDINNDGKGIFGHESSGENMDDKVEKGKGDATIQPVLECERRSMRVVWR